MSEQRENREYDYNDTDNAETARYAAQRRAGYIPTLLHRGRIR